MNVHLVLIEDRLLGRCVPGEAAKPSENAQPALSIPRAEHGRLRHSEPRAERGERSAHGTGGDARLPAPLELEAEQLAVRVGR
jgi:hypothetical protein